jgi:hypothetical protein
MSTGKTILCKHAAIAQDVGQVRSWSARRAAQRLLAFPKADARDCRIGVDTGLTMDSRQCNDQLALSASFEHEMARGAHRSY